MFFGSEIFSKLGYENDDNTLQNLIKERIRQIMRGKELLWLLAGYFLVFAGVFLMCCSSIWVLLLGVLVAGTGVHLVLQAITRKEKEDAKRRRRGLN